MDNNQINASGGKVIDGRIMSVILIVIGGGALIGAFFVYTNAQIPSNYVKTTGTIQNATIAGPVNNGSMQTTQSNLEVSFTAQDGTNHTFKTTGAAVSNNNKSAFKTGDQLEVAYNPSSPDNKPKNAQDPATPITAFIIGAIGSFFALIGVLGLLTALFYKKR